MQLLKYLISFWVIQKVYTDAYVNPTATVEIIYKPYHYTYKLLDWMLHVIAASKLKCSKNIKGGQTLSIPNTES